MGTPLGDDAHPRMAALPVLARSLLVVGVLRAPPACRPGGTGAIGSEPKTSGWPSLVMIKPLARHAAPSAQITRLVGDGSSGVRRIHSRRTRPAAARWRDDRWAGQDDWVGDANPAR